MKEIDVFNHARAYLRNKEFEVIQLVPPGGQAPLSVSYLYNGKRKTIFPDLLAIKNSQLWVGEFKPGFDKLDYDKLMRLRSSGEGQVRDLCSRMTKGECQIRDVNYVLCHADHSSSDCPKAWQWIFGVDGQEPIIRSPSH